MSVSDGYPIRHKGSLMRRCVCGKVGKTHGSSSDHTKSIYVMNKGNLNIKHVQYTHNLKSTFDENLYENNIHYCQRH